MRTLALLVLLLGLPVMQARAQESDAPEGAVVDSVEMAGFSPYSLSPGLQKEMDSLVGTPLRRERLNEIVSRIEGEQPEMVAAVRSVARPDGKAHVVFLVARISDDTGLSENINARYVVESVDIEERTDFNLMREFIDRVFTKYLSPRERKILYLYYGLEEGSEAMTLERIGALMGVTRERIRQIRERAFEKLRESPDGRALASFWSAA